MTAATRALTGAVIVEARALKTIRSSGPSAMLAAIAPKTRPPTMTIRKATTIAPKTCQPLPRTISRERPKAAITGDFSTTITGAITAQIVSRIRPGTISKIRPMPIAEPGQDAGPDQRQDEGRRRAEQLAGGEVAAPVLDVADQVHDHALVEGPGGDPDHRGDQQQEQAGAAMPLRIATTRKSQKATGSSTPALSR